MTIEEFEAEAREYRPYFYRYPQPVLVAIHWTGGHYNQTFNAYHYNIGPDGDIINTLPLDKIPEATWLRNTGSIAITMDACYKGTPLDLGPEPPTEAQIETMARMMAVISRVFEIPINKEHFLTHGEIADMDGYGLTSGDPDCRWDLQILHTGDEYGTGGDILRKKAAEYV